VALLRRRMPEAPTTLRERDRALGILVRKGYALDVAHAALRRHAGVPEPD
jgi:regulatory protein